MEQQELLALIAEARTGDGPARERLVAETQNKVYYHCKKYLKNDADAQDAAQDVLIAMLTNLDKLHEPAAFWGWLNRITVNRCKHALTAPHREYQIPEDEDGGSMLDNLETLDDQTIPDAVLDTDETRRIILDIIDALPDEQRMTVIFFYYDEMSVKDIAAAMQVSEGTVKSRLNYARKAIRREVEALEKKDGTKLYSVSILPFLAYFLRRGAQSEALVPATAQAMARTVLAQSGAAAGTVAASTAAAAGAKAAAGVSAKVIAGILAGVVALGGIGAGVYVATRAGEEPAPTPIPAPVLEAPATPASTEEPAASAPEYGEAYAAVVRELDDRLGPDARYALVYIDGDGVPELLAKLDVYNDFDGVVEYSYYLYAYSGGAAREIGSFEHCGLHSAIPAYFPGENLIYQTQRFTMTPDCFCMGEGGVIQPTSAELPPEDGALLDAELIARRMLELLGYPAGERELVAQMVQTQSRKNFSKP